MSILTLSPSWERNQNEPGENRSQTIVAFSCSPFLLLNPSGKQPRPQNSTWDNPQVGHWNWEFKINVCSLCQQLLTERKRLGIHRSQRVHPKQGQKSSCGCVQASQNSLSALWLLGEAPGKAQIHPRINKPGLLQSDRNS